MIGIHVDGGQSNRFRGKSLFIFSHFGAVTNSSLATGTDTKLLVAQDTQQVKRASFEGSPGPPSPRLQTLCS